MKQTSFIYILLLCLGLFFNNVHARQKKFPKPLNNSRKSLNSSINSKNYIYPFRDINNPILKDNSIGKIVVLSLPRTGSTLVYMVAQYLFENILGIYNSFDKLVVKSHNIETCKRYFEKHPDTHFIIPIRNPNAILASILKVEKNTNTNNVLKYTELIISEFHKMASFIKAIPNNKILLCEYEAFNKDLSYLTSTIENKFQKTIPRKEKDNIQHYFSKAAIDQLNQNFSSFKQYDSILGLHGRHISQDRRSLSEILPSHLFDKIQERFEELTPALNFLFRS